MVQPAPLNRAQRIDAIFSSPLDNGIDLLPRAAGVYGMWNRATRMWNVGQSADVHKRCLGHAKQLQARKASNHRIQRDIDRHGADAFFYMVLELAIETDPKTRQRELNQLEIWWVVQLRAHDERFGYNAEEGGLRTKGARLRDRERKLMRLNSRKYELLPWVDMYDPIHPGFLATCVLGS